MNKLRYIPLLVALFSLFACSDSETEELSETTAQQVFNRLKGTYRGVAAAGTTPQRVTIVIGDAISIYDLPPQLFIERIFTDSNQQAEALNAAPYGTTFSAPIIGLSILSSQVALSADDADLSFSFTMAGETYNVTALTTTNAIVDLMSNSVSVRLVVKELLCNGNPVDMGEAPVSYFIDSALRQDPQQD